MVIELAGVDQLLDLAGQIRSDARDLRQLAIRVARDVLQALGIALDAALGAVVGNRLELPLGVLLKDAQDRADLFKDSGDFAVFHVLLATVAGPTERYQIERTGQTPHPALRATLSRKGRGHELRSLSPLSPRGRGEGGEGCLRLNSAGPSNLSVVRLITTVREMKTFARETRAAIAAEFLIGFIRSAARWASQSQRFAALGAELSSLAIIGLTFGASHLDWLRKRPCFSITATRTNW